MVYHFVKHIGIDVEADSLETATEVVDDLVNHDDFIEDEIADCIGYGDFANDIDDFDVHIGHAEYVGYTEDEESDPEERLYDYLTDEDDGVCYTITDKGRDYLAHLRGEYPEYDESGYDEYGKRITPNTDEALQKIIDGVVSSMLRSLFTRD